MFQQMYWCFKKIVDVDTVNYIYFWKSKGLSDEHTAAPNTSDYSLNPQLSYLGTKTRVDVRWTSLKQENIYLKTSPTLINCLFGAVSLSKNSDIDKYKYSSYGIGFDKGGICLVSNGFSRNVIIFGVDMSLHVYVDNKGKTF